MTDLKLAKERRSVRSFDGKALDASVAERIMRFAESADNPYGIKIGYRLLKVSEHKLSSPVIVGADTFIAGKCKKVEHAEEAFGYSFEKIVLFCQGLGIGTTWIAGTMDRQAFEKAMELSEDEVMPCVSPLGFPALKMSIREGLMRKAIKADTREPFERLFFEGDFNTPYSGDLSDAFEMVRLAPSAVNKQPWRLIKKDDRVHFYLAHGKGFGDGAWDIQKIDIGIAMCHFQMGLKTLGKDCALELSNPNISHPDGFEYIGTFRII